MKSFTIDIAPAVFPQNRSSAKRLLAREEPVETVQKRRESYAGGWNNSSGEREMKARIIISMRNLVIPRGRILPP